MFKYYVVATLAVSLGVFLVYRNTIPYDKMIKVDSKVVSKRLDLQRQSDRGGSTTYYSMMLKTKALNYEIEIPISMDYFDTSSYSFLDNSFDTTKIYSFYLNPFDRGLEKAQYNSQILYLEPLGQKNIVMGWVLIIGSFIGIVNIAKRNEPERDNKFWAKWGKR
jgi:hypothetical protein